MVHRRVRKVFAFVGASAAVGAIGAGVAGAASAQLTLHASRLYVTWGHRLALTGTETAGGHAVSGAVVRLLANSFPFTAGFKPAGTAVSNAHGAYQFTVRPDRATRYKAVAVGQSASSRVVTAYVIPKDSVTCNICNFRNGPGPHTLTVTDTYTFPPGTASGYGPAYFYYGQTTGASKPPATLRLVKTGPLTQIAANKLHDGFSYKVQFPTGVFEFEYVTCFKDREAATGIGLPGHHHCGDAELTQSELGYLG